VEGSHPIRVLRLITRLNMGGPAKHVAWLMEGLPPQEFPQRLVTGRVAKGEDDLGPELAARGIHFAVIPEMGREIHPLRDLVALARIWAWLARVRPHILATHTAKAGFLGRMALWAYRPWARLRGWPVPQAVHTFHGHTFHGYFGPLKTRLFLFLERTLARFATWRIVAISPGQFQEICHTYRVGRPEQYVIVPLGLDLETFARTQEGRAAFRAELGAAEDEVLVGAVGRVAPVKNYGLFLEAAARLKRSRPELYARCRFVLIGGGSPADMALLSTQARVLGLKGKVVFTGNRNDPHCFFPGLDLLMLTSLNEGTPLSILEGGACGLPVVATEVGGVPDILGETARDMGAFRIHLRGLGTASGNAEGLAAALAWLLDHPGQAQTLGQALRRYVHRNHGKDRLVRDIALLYRTSAGGGSPLMTCGPRAVSVAGSESPDSHARIGN